MDERKKENVMTCICIGKFIYIYLSTWHEITTKNVDINKMMHVYFVLLSVKKLKDLGGGEGS